MAVLGRGDNGRASHGGVPETADVVDDDDVGVEVDHAANTRVDEVSDVGSRVVERILEGFSDGRGDEATDSSFIELINLEAERREDGANDGVEIIIVGDDEMEVEVFRAGGVLENGVDGGDGTTEVVGVKGHGDVNNLVGGACIAVAEMGSF